MVYLVKLIIFDGEGVFKFIEYQVVGVFFDKVVCMLVCEILDFILVKVVMFGCGFNWGCIVCVVGNVGVLFDYVNVDLYLGDNEILIQVLDKGKFVDFDCNYVKWLFWEFYLCIWLDMNVGDGQGVGWGVDLIMDYVMFNLVYII